MKTIIITGPSGSGKTYLSNKLSKTFTNSIILKTDYFYRDNILIQFLSIFIHDIYDRPLSMKKNEITNTLKSLYNKDRLVSFYKYDFEKKHSTQSKIRIKYKGYNQFLILEGIFSHRLDLDYKNTINIVCEEKKEICFKRRLKRDKLERGREIRDVNNKFNKSWFLFKQNIQNFINKNKVMVINQLDKNSYNKLVLNLQNLKKND